MSSSRQNNQRPRLSKLSRKVIIFFNRKRTKEVMTFLLFVALSACFWVMQTVYEETDGSFEVQFVVRNMPSNAVFTTPVPSTLKVTVHDRSIALIRYYLKHSLQQLTVDFDRYADEAGNFRLSGAELYALIQEGLDGPTQVSTVTPAIIDARFALTSGRRVPVRFDGTCSAQLQSRCSEVRLTPDSVTVYAPDGILDTLREVRTVRRDYEELATSVSEDVPLYTPLGVKAEPAQVHLDVAVEEYVEKTFARVHVETMMVPESLKLRTFPSMVQLSCNVNLSQYKDLTADEFVLSVSYEDIPTDGASTARLPIRVTSHPDAATHIRIRPDSVEYLIEEVTN
jgi:hypothetical protein